MVFDLFLDGYFKRIQELEVGGFLRGFDHGLSQLDRAFTAICPMRRDNRVHCTEPQGRLANQFHFGGGIRCERVNCYDHVHAVFQSVLNVAFEVRQTLAE